MGLAIRMMSDLNFDYVGYYGYSVFTVLDIKILNHAIFLTRKPGMGLFSFNCWFKVY